MIYRFHISSHSISKTLLSLSFCLFSLSIFCQTEICNNAIDDDNDGLIDLNDDDCICKIADPTSLIPNPSFEEQDCCPFNKNQLHCATGWIQASEPTTDYINSCGWLGWDQFPPPTPFPDGNGIMGFRDGRVRNNNIAEPFWKEYAGACLTNPLIKDTTYRFQFDIGFSNIENSPPINISFFGTTDCNYLPFGTGNPTVGCPTNVPNWVKLGDVFVDSEENSWINTVIEVTPSTDIYAIAIGPDCPDVIHPVSTYYFFDNLVLADINSFDQLISESNHPCDPEFSLSVPENPDATFQWYKDGIALIGESSAAMSQNYGEGIYQVVIDNGFICRVSTEYDFIIPVFENHMDEVICDGESFFFEGEDFTEPGTYTNITLDDDGCENISTLNLEVSGEQIDTIDVVILDGQEFEIGNLSFTEPGAYPLTFTSSLGCDSLVLLNLESFKLYIPNAFTPNNDGINETFAPLTSDGIIENIDMRIYDRWGNLIYRGTEWNGRDAIPGIYAYVIEIEFSNNLAEQFFGHITLTK